MPENKEYPENLCALVPGIIPALPSDPFYAKDFIYKLNAPGSFVLYSPGINIKDDKGSITDDLLIFPVNGEMKS